MPEIAGIGLVGAFVAGLVSFLSPCILPLVPGYVSFIAGRSLDELTARQTSTQRFAVMGSSLLFVAGFSAIFISMGAGASAIGSLFQAYRYEAAYVAGAIVIVFGLHMSGFFNFGWMNRDWRLPFPTKSGRPFASVGLGAAFAFGWTPCIGPILATILGLGATRLGVADGITLLSIYSLGLAVPFLLVAAFLDRFLVQFRRFQKVGRHLRRLAGVLMILIGVAMTTGHLTSFGTWMLRQFPIFESVVL